MNDRTAASRRAIVDGASPRRPRPSSAVYSASACTSTSVDCAAGPLQPAAEIREVGCVGPPGRLGEAGAGEIPIDRRAHLHPVGFAPSPVLPARCAPPSSSQRSSSSLRSCALVVVRNPLSPAPPASRGTVTLVGDSLNVGIERYVPGLCPGGRSSRTIGSGRIDARGHRRARGGRPAAVELRRRQPRHERSADGRDGVPQGRRSACSSSSARTDASSGRRSGATVSRTTRSTRSCATRPERTDG